MITYQGPSQATKAITTLLNGALVKGVERVWTRPAPRGRLHTVVRFTDNATEADRRKARRILHSAHHSTSVRSDGCVVAMSLQAAKS